MDNFDKFIKVFEKYLWDALGWHRFFKWFYWKTKLWWILHD